MAEEYVRVLPYLTKSEVEERDYLEADLARDLSRCLRGDRIDEERAEHLMNSAAVSIFDMEHLAYSNRPGYEPEWIDHIIYESIWRVVQRANNISWSDTKSLYTSLVKTVTHHAEQIPKKIVIPPSGQTNPQVFSPTGKEAAEYAKAGVDLSSGPPLLIAAIQQASARSSPASPSLLPTDLSLVEQRKALLDAYKAKTGASNHKIYMGRNSGIHKPEFYAWVKGTLPNTSATAINFERFLRDQKPPIPRNAK
jgi:hypothetical protein